MEVSKLTEISNLVLEAVEQASDIVMEIYNSGDLKVEDKHDGSPVTTADKKCHEILFNSLKSIDANIPILSEEGDTEENREDLFWLIDPLDGTSNFFRNIPICAVSVALVQKNIPVIGVINDFLNKYKYILNMNMHKLTSIVMNNHICVWSVVRVCVCVCVCVHVRLNDEATL